MYPEDKQKEVPYPMSRKNPFVMPILKWVGGKRQLLDSINPLIPECSTYYEPFIGGGAVLFGRQPNKAVINKNPNITNEATIHALNTYLNKANITIKCGDYREALKGIRKGAFVYFDPPYMPISSSASFTGYTAGGFGEEEQIALKEQCDMLNAKGIKFLLSNSSCEFIEDLYKDYIIDHVDAKRAINVKPEKRGEIQEVLVRNYELD